MQRQKRDKMENLTAKKYLESKGLCSHDYMDSGMINHISEIMEEYHQAKLHLLNLPVVVGRGEQLHSCRYVKRIGESCTLNNNCKYPNCE
jgi:hypothetical protein